MSLFIFSFFLSVFLRRGRRVYWLSGIAGLDLKEEIHTSGCGATDLLDRTVKGVLGKAIKKKEKKVLLLLLSRFRSQILNTVCIIRSETEGVVSTYIIFLDIIPYLGE